MENWSTRPKGKTIGIYTFCILKIKRTLLICLFQSFVFPQFSSSLDLTFPHVIAAGGHGMRKRPQDSRQLKVALGNCGNISTKKGKWCWKKDKEYVRLSLSWSCFTNALIIFGEALEFPITHDEQMFNTWVLKVRWQWHVNKLYMISIIALGHTTPSNFYPKLCRIKRMSNLFSYWISPAGWT